MRSTSFAIPVALHTTSSLKSLSVSRGRRNRVEQVSFVRLKRQALAARHGSRLGLVLFGA